MAQVPLGVITGDYHGIGLRHPKAWRHIKSKTERPKQQRKLHMAFAVAICPFRIMYIAAFQIHPGE